MQSFPLKLSGTITRCLSAQFSTAKISSPPIRYVAVVTQTSFSQGLCLFSMSCIVQSKEVKTLLVCSA